MTIITVLKVGTLFVQPIPKGWASKNLQLPVSSPSVFGAVHKAPANYAAESFSGFASWLPNRRVAGKDARIERSPSEGSGLGTPGGSAK